MTARTQRVFAWVVASGCLIGACLPAALAVLNHTAVAAGIGLSHAAASFVATGVVAVVAETTQPAAVGVCVRHTMAVRR